MVGYASNFILTVLKVIFETNGVSNLSSALGALIPNAMPHNCSQNKLTLHLVSAYVNILAASSYAMLWTGYSPILPDVQSCL